MDDLHGLRSGCAELRAEGIRRWTAWLGDEADLVPLLDDDAPVVRLRAGRPVLVEVRAIALAALQARRRSLGGWPYGPVTVRRAVPVDEALNRAMTLLAGLAPADRAEVERAVERDLAARVVPPPQDEAACRAYLTLLALEAADGRTDAGEVVTEAIAERSYHLDLSNRGLTELPPSIAALPWLEYLVLDGNELPELPDVLTSLPSLVVLSLRGNAIERLPAHVRHLTHLTELDLSDNSLTDLPDEIGHLTDLETLDLTGNALTRVPASIGRLSALRELRLYGNRLQALPPELGRLHELRALHLGGNEITRLPPELAGLTGLQVLTGLDDEPLMDRDWLAENPGYWAATPQQVIAAVLAEQARTAGEIPPERRGSGGAGRS